MNIRKLDQLIEVKLLDFPDSRQSRSFSCGASALQSVLVYYGFDVREYEVMKQVGTDEDGSPVENIKKILNDYGFKYQEGSFSVKDLKDFIDKDIPVIILIQAWSDNPKDSDKDADYVEDWEDGHYVVAIGYDDENIVFDDPSIHSQRGYISQKELPRRWHDVDRKKNTTYKQWGIAIFGKPARFKSKDKIKIQ